MTTERNDYITGCVAKMHERGIPEHMISAFVQEAALRPEEYPILTQDVNETYPDPAAWEAKARCYEAGILHWEWADGSGFPPSEGERREQAHRDAAITQFDNPTIDVVPFGAVR